MTWGQEISLAAEHLRETAGEVMHLMDEKTKALLARTDGSATQPPMRWPAPKACLTAYRRVPSA